MFTTGQAAAKLGCAKDTVRRQAERLKLGIRTPLGMVLTAAEIEQIRPLLRAPGNPNFVPGNYFGQPRKKLRKSKKSSR